MPTLNVTLYDEGAVDHSYIYLTPNNVPGQGPYVFSQSGQLVFNITNRLGKVYDFKPCTYQKTLRYCLWQTTGSVYNGYGNGTASIFDGNFQFIHALPTSDYHEFTIKQSLDPSTGAVSDVALLTTYNSVKRDLSAYGIANENDQGWVLDCHLQAIDATSNKILFDWSALDHVPLSESLVQPTGAINGLTSQFAWDYFHMNSIARLGNGDYILSSRHTSTIYLISGANGSILWRLGGKASSFTLQNFGFSSQHDVRVLSSDPEKDTMTLSFFDNAYNTFTPAQGDSSGKIVELNTATKTARLVQQFNPPQPGFQSGDGGSVQVLPGGNVLVGWGSIPYVIEYTKEGKLVYEAHFGTVGSTASSYRVFKAPYGGVRNPA
ncbi:MAG: hypothetical protein Q9201_001982 [Fulgogasparrea decipioides]